MSKPILGYYDIRGLAQPIRSLLVYAGVDFTEKHYSYDVSQMKSPEWLAVKFTLGFDFPNVPYLIDGDVKLTQSLAILRYLGRKYGLEGATETEKNRVALLEQQVQDLLLSMQRSLMAPKESLEGAKADYLKGLPDQLKGVSAFLGANQYAVGGTVTYVDFYLYEYLIKIIVHAPGELEKWDNLVQYVKRIEALPKLAEWLQKKGPQRFTLFPGFPYTY